MAGRVENERDDRGLRVIRELGIVTPQEQLIKVELNCRLSRSLMKPRSGVCSCKERSGEVDITG